MNWNCMASVTKLVQSRVLWHIFKCELKFEGEVEFLLGGIKLPKMATDIKSGLPRATTGHCGRPLLSHSGLCLGSGEYTDTHLA